MPKSARSRIGRPPTGKALSAAERMRNYRARHRAAGLRSVTRLEAPIQALSGGTLRHRILDARSLAMHCMAAAKVEQNRSLLRVVKKTLDGWRARYEDEVPSALEEWRWLIERPWGEVSAIITDPGERATPLRPSSPFSTILRPKERERIYDPVRS